MLGVRLDFTIIFTSFSFHRALHHCHVPQIPSRTLRLFVLPETAQQRHIQRAKRQTLLPCLFRQTFRLRWPCAFPKPGSFYRLGSFQCYSSLEADRTPETTQRTSFELWRNKYASLNLENKKFEKQLRSRAKEFSSRFNIVRLQFCFSFPYLLPSGLTRKESYCLYSLLYLHYYPLCCSNHSLLFCPHCLFSYCKLRKCNHVNKQSNSPKHCFHLYLTFPCLCHILLYSSSLPNAYYQLLPYLILPTDFVISYHNLSVAFQCSSCKETFLWRNGMLATPLSLQLQFLLELQFLYLIFILLSLKMKILLQVILLSIGALKIISSIYCVLLQVCRSNCYIYITYLRKSLLEN